LKLQRISRIGLGSLLGTVMSAALSACPQKPDRTAVQTPPTKPGVELDGDAMTITDPETGAVLTLGDAEASLPAYWPEWLQQYPGSTVKLHYARDNADGKSDVVMLETADSPAKALEFYLSRAQGAGLRLTDDSRGPQGSACTLVSKTHTLNLIMQPGSEKTSVTLQLLRAAHDRLPDETQVSWIEINALPSSWPAELLPLYPCATVRFVNIKTDPPPGEYSLQFTARATNKKIHAWYAAHFGKQQMKSSPDSLDPSGAQASFQGDAGEIQLTCFPGESDNQVNVKLTFHRASKQI